MSTTNEFIRTLKTSDGKYFTWTTLVWGVCRFHVTLVVHRLTRLDAFAQATQIVCDRVVVVVRIHCFLLSNFISILCISFPVEMHAHCGWHCHGKEISENFLLLKVTNENGHFCVSCLFLLSGHWRRAQVWHWHWCWVPTDLWLALQSVHRCCRRSSIV